MRHLRWKQKFISGFNCLDNSKHQLFQQLQSLQAEMSQTEHCQDMRQLMDDLNAQAHGLFQVKVPNQLQTHTVGINLTLEQSLPLAALNTPACRACSVCDHTDALLHTWLEQTQSIDNDDQECAA